MGVGGWGGRWGGGGRLNIPLVYISVNRGLSDDMVPCENLCTL